MNKKHVLIIGGGFAGIQTALQLSKKRYSKDIQVTLVSNRVNFEYQPSLHTFLSVSGVARYAQIHLEEIFHKTNVQLIIDTVTDCNLDQKKVILQSGNELHADYIVLATGSEPAYFGIPGLAESAFSFQSVYDANRLRKHLLQIFGLPESRDQQGGFPTESSIVVVGAGPNGVDLAGELAEFIKILAQKKGLENSGITISLVEGAPTILPMMSVKAQVKAVERLEKLGVEILCGKQLLRQTESGIEFSDGSLETKTVIWTAGATGNSLVAKIPGVQLQKKNRITLDEYLQISGHKNIFAIGDIGDTKYAGLAQTAIHNGSYVAKKIIADVQGKQIDMYKPSPVAYNIGVGHGWSIMQIGNMVISGKIASWARSVINMKYFFSILPFRKVLQLFFSTKKPLV